MYFEYIFIVCENGMKLESGLHEKFARSDALLPEGLIIKSYEVVRLSCVYSKIH